MKGVKINITGDVFLGRRIEPLAIQNPSLLFGNGIVDLFASSDLNILNLESPLTFANERDRILKTGPNLKASPETIRALRMLNTNMVTLANNHIYDYGEKGLSDTLELCRENNISTVGAGKTFDEASAICLKDFDGIKLAVVNIAENEWCNSSEYRGGANPMNIIANAKTLNRAKEMADVVIMIIHGGHELYYYPSPRMVEQYRFYADQGASIIVGHHSHCISGYEVYNEVPIFYGLGNFLFDSDIDFKGWHQGLVLSIQLELNQSLKWNLLPVRQDKNELRVDWIEGVQKANFEEELDKINRVIQNPEILEKEFLKLIDSRREEYLSYFSTLNFFKNRYIRSGLIKLGLKKFFLRRSNFKDVLNCLRCEAHHDTASRIIWDYISSDKS